MRRKFIMLSIITILLTSVITFAFKLLVKKPSNTPNIDSTDTKYQSKILPKPFNKDPKDLTALENLYISAGVMKKQKTYQFHGQGKVIAKTGLFGSFTQNVTEDAAYKNGNFVLTGISPAAMKMARVIEEHFENANQGVFLVRKGDADGAEGKNLRWNEKPTRYSKADYSNKYGIKTHTPSVFILRDETIIEAKQEILADGTIKITVELKADKASEVYKRTIMTQGGAGECDYEKITFTTYIDKDWQTLKTETSTIYRLDIGSGTTCNSYMDHTYTYEDKELEQLEYYKKYASIADNGPEEQENPIQILGKIYEKKLESGINLKLLSDKLGDIAFINVKATKEGKFIIAGELVKFGYKFKFIDNKVYLYKDNTVQVIDINSLLEIANSEDFKSSGLAKIISQLKDLLPLDKLTSGEIMSLDKDENDDYIISINLSIATLRIHTKHKVLDQNTNKVEYSVKDYELMSPSLAKYLGRLKLQETDKVVDFDTNNLVTDYEELIKNTLKTGLLSIKELQVRKENTKVSIKNLVFNLNNQTANGEINLNINNIKFQFSFYLTKDGIYLDINNHKLFFNFNDFDKIASLISAINTKFDVSSLVKPILELINMLQTNDLKNIDYKKVINKFLIIIDNLPKFGSSKVSITEPGNNDYSRAINKDEYTDILSGYSPASKFINRIIDNYIINNYAFNFNYEQNDLAINGTINYLPLEKTLVFEAVIKKQNTELNIKGVLTKDSLTITYNNKVYTLTIDQIKELIATVLTNINKADLVNVINGLLNNDFTKLKFSEELDINEALKELTITPESIIIKALIKKFNIEFSLNDKAELNINSFKITESSKRLSYSTETNKLSDQDFNKLLNIASNLAKFYLTQELNITKLTLNKNNTLINIIDFNLSLKEQYVSFDLEVSNDKFTARMGLKLINDQLYLIYNGETYQIDFNALALIKEYFLESLDINLITNLKNILFSTDDLLTKLAKIFNLTKDFNFDLNKLDPNLIKDFLNLELKPHAKINKPNTYKELDNELLRNLFSNAKTIINKLNNLKNGVPLTFGGSAELDINSELINLIYNFNIYYLNKELSFIGSINFNNHEIKLSYKYNEAYFEYNNQVVKITKNNLVSIIREILVNLNVASDKIEKIIGLLNDFNLDLGTKININELVKKITILNNGLNFILKYKDNEYSIILINNEISSEFNFNNLKAKLNLGLNNNHLAEINQANYYLIKDEQVEKINNLIKVLFKFSKEQKLALNNLEFNKKDTLIKISNFNLSLVDKYLSLDLEVIAKEFKVKFTIKLIDDKVYLIYNNKTYSLDFDNLDLVNNHFLNNKLELAMINDIKDTLFSGENLTDKLFKLVKYLNKLNNTNPANINFDEVFKYLALDFSTQVDIDIPSSDLHFDKATLENTINNLSGLITKIKEIIKTKEAKLMLEGTLNITIKGEISNVIYKVYLHLKDKDLLLKVDAAITNAKGEITDVKLIYNLADFVIKYNNQVIKISSVALKEVVENILKFFNVEEELTNYILRLFSKTEFTLASLLKLELPQIDINNTIKEFDLFSDRVSALINKQDKFKNDFNLNVLFNALGIETILDTEKGLFDLKARVIPYEEITIDDSSATYITDNDLANFAKLLETFKPIYDKKELSIKNLDLDLGNGNVIRGEMDLDLNSLSAKIKGYAIINKNKFSFSLVIKDRIIYLNFFKNLRTKLAIEKLSELKDLFTNMGLDVSNVDFNNITSSLTDIENFFNKGIIKKVMDNILDLFITKDKRYELLMKTISMLNSGDTQLECDEITVDEIDKYEDFETKLNFLNNLFKLYKEKDLTHALEHNYEFSGSIIGLDKDSQGNEYERNKLTFRLNLALAYGMYNNFRIKGTVIDHTRKDQTHTFDLTYNDKVFYLNYGDMYAHMSEKTMKGLIMAIMSGLSIKSELLEQLLNANAEDYGNIFAGYIKPQTGHDEILDLDKIVLNASVNGNIFDVEVDKEVLKHFNSQANLTARLSINQNDKIQSLMMNYLYVQKNDYLNFELVAKDNNLEAILTDQEKARYTIDLKNLDQLVGAFFRTANKRKYHIKAMGEDNSIKAKLAIFNPDLKQIDFKIIVDTDNNYIMHLHFYMHGNATYMKSGFNTIDLYIKNRQVMAKIAYKDWFGWVTYHWEKYYEDFLDQDQFVDNLADVLCLSTLVRNELKKNIKPNGNASQYDKDKLPLFDALLKSYVSNDENSYNIVSDLRKVLDDKQFNDLATKITLANKVIKSIDLKTKISVMELQDCRFELLDDNDSWDITLPPEIK